jgi:hypothetical protein
MFAMLKALLFTTAENFVQQVSFLQKKKLAQRSLESPLRTCRTLASELKKRKKKTRGRIF